MTAHLMGEADTEQLMNEWLWVLRDAGYNFNHNDVSVMRTGSDYGADWYVVTGLVTSSFDVWILYVEQADNLRITVFNVPDSGSPASVSKVIDVEQATLEARGI